MEQIIKELADDFKNQLKEFSNKLLNLEKEREKIISNTNNYKLLKNEYELTSSIKKKLTKIEDKQNIINKKIIILEPILQKVMKELEEEYKKIIIQKAIKDFYL